MSIFLQLVVNGLIAGAIYSLVASGFSLIYSTCKFVHFAHGITVALGAYFLYFFFSILGIDFWISSILAVASASLGGWGMHLIYAQLRKRKSSKVILLLASFATLTLSESFILLFFRADVKTIGYIKTTKGMEFLGAIITPLQLYIIIISIILLTLLFFFMKKTKLGKALRAVSNNKDVAAIVGISPERTYLWSFIIGSAIAGIAGILIGLEQNLEPTMGTQLIIKGFTGAVVGGITSVPGAVLGSFLLGFAENFGIWYLPSGYKDAIAFAILFIFLLFKPNGILGIKRGGEKS